jgi:hypothetical protein
VHHIKNLVLRHVVEGFLECAEFTAPEDISAKCHDGWRTDSVTRAETVCREFMARVNTRLWARCIERYEETSRAYGYTGEHALGHDLCFSMQGAGVGFWDRERSCVRSLNQYVQRREINVWLSKRNKLVLEVD